MRIERVTDAMFSPARDVLGRAFHSYPLMEYAQPDTRKRLVGTRHLYGGMLWDAMRLGEVYTTGEIEGVACWLPPGIGPMTFGRQLRAGMARLPFSFGLTGMRRLIAYDQVSITLHHRYAPEPHWYLLALGVDSDKQGRGIGSFLLRPHLERADEEKLPCYLDTHLERNVRLYEKHGFRVMWQGTLAGHPIPAWSMRRDPKPLC